MSSPIFCFTTMALESKQLHFLLFPFMAQGHMIPMADIAKLLARHGVIITIITTPLNAKRFAEPFARAAESGLQIQLIELEFPSEEAGLPKESESMDMLPSLGLGGKFFVAPNKLQEQVERVFQELTPRPSCIISDMCLPYTSRIATKFGVPRISFCGFSCLASLCSHNLRVSGVLDSITSETEKFLVPDVPDHIEMTKNQLPTAILQNMQEFCDQARDAEMVTYGVIINSFQEMEPEYVELYKKIRGGKVWCIGPVSQCNKDNLDKIQRGNRASIDESKCLNWLDSQQPASVIYVCLGSLCNLVTSQLIELALGLEASNKPFIWAIRGGEHSKELENWVAQDGFEERTKERGLLIRGWAPQVLILSHPAIGGFLTHCGWNSTFEAITAGVPMVTWPLFGDQFLNEKFVLQLLKIGVRVGAETTVKWGEEEKMGVLVGKEDVAKAIEELMNDGVESEERRRRAKEVSKKAEEAIEEGGSSYLNMELLIEDIRQQQAEKQQQSASTPPHGCSQEISVS